MDYMLSLVSNPYDPFTQYELWDLYDRSEGFNTAGLLARVLSTSESISEADQDRATEFAIDSIVNNMNFVGLYKKVSRERAKQ